MAAAQGVQLQRALLLHAHVGLPDLPKPRGRQKAAGGRRAGGRREGGGRRRNRWGKPTGFCRVSGSRHFCFRIWEPGRTRATTTEEEKASTINRMDKEILSNETAGFLGFAHVSCTGGGILDEAGGASGKVPRVSGRPGRREEGFLTTPPGKPGRFSTGGVPARGRRDSPRNRRGKRGFPRGLPGVAILHLAFRFG